MTARCAINVQPADDLRAALFPLFAAGHVDAIEWTWEAGVPTWLATLVAFYASQGALYTHLVGYPLTGDDASLPRRLASVAHQSRRQRPRHVTAHFGVVQVDGMSAMAPLPPVPCAEVRSVGRERLVRLMDAAESAVGVENLAFAFSADDVARQAELLDGMLVDQSFLLLDLHNVYCQAVAFDCSPEALLGRYPLERVREIHVSGGSTYVPSVDSRPFRRDTHDDAVPDQVFSLLDFALSRCPAVEVVCLERLGGTVGTSDGRAALARDFATMRERVEAAPSMGIEAGAHPLPGSALPSVPVGELRAFEADLVEVLRSERTVDGARATLRSLVRDPTLATFVACMEPRAIEVAMDMQRRWSEPNAAPVAARRS